MGIKIAIKKDEYREIFEGDEYVIELGVNYDYNYKEGDLICHICPWGILLPNLRLEFAIRKDGTMHLRVWDMQGNGNNYLHTHEKPDGKYPFQATAEQIDTVSGLFSGRIRFNGLKIAVGASVQHVCPIDLEKEEELIGRTIYLA